ncbi:hypothetical protein ACXJJ3_14170 [Kribbella sp. WER1]
MPDPIADELRRLAGPDLYRRNAFRISGLLADADARTARQVAQRLRAALAVGADVDLGTATSRDPHEIQAACDLILGDPRRRLVHEMFAPWGDDVSSCGCSPTLHRNHDAAVAAHSSAISKEQDGGRPDVDWNSAWQSWSKVVGASTAHLESRVRDLDDRQLDRTAVTGLERELPRTLVQPAVDLAVAAPLKRAGVLVKLARKFPQAEQLHRRLLESAAAPFYEDLEDRRTRIAQRIGIDPADGIVDEIEKELLPKLRRLDALLPSKENHRTSGLHDQVAILLNNCAVDLMNRGEDADGRAERWLDLASRIAIDQREHDLINENRQGIGETQRAIRDFRDRVYAIQRAQGKSAATRVLRSIRHSTTSPTVIAEIDRMLAEFGRGTTTRKRQPVRGPVRRPVYVRRRPWRRVWVVLIIALALIALSLWRWWPRHVDVFNQKIADNPPAGVCLGKPGDDPTALRKGNCDADHWGEVIAYVPITKVPSAYPGDVQANALAYFACGEAVAQQHLDHSGFTVQAFYAGAKDWNDGKHATSYENYATCVIHHEDGEPMVAGAAARPDAPKTSQPVLMSLFARDRAQNAPVGTCVQKLPAGDASVDVGIVRCTEWHWAQIVSYPTIYPAGTPWPGDDAVVARARKTCSRGIPGRPGFATTPGSPDHSWWSEPKQVMYAYCLVHRADDKPFKGALT